MDGVYAKGLFLGASVAMMLATAGAFAWDIPSIYPGVTTLRERTIPAPAVFPVSIRETEV